MKITGSRINSFLAGPDPAACRVLVYGPDRGLVRERADALVLSGAGEVNDPFRVTELTPESLKGDPALLADEARAFSFSGSRRVIRIRGATDALTKTFKDFLDGDPADALVVVEAGELPKRSSLRGLFERAGNAAAMACYGDDERGLKEVIANSLGRNGLSASPDALAFLVSNLGSDRIVTRSELEKLALYKGAPGTVSLEDAQACVGDSAASSLDAVVYAAAGGDRSGLDRALSRVFMEGVPPVSVLRAAARHLQRLHLATGLVSQGRTPDQAMKALRPPVIFKFVDRFRGQLRSWPNRRLADALELITEAELDCKTTGLPAQAVCGRALMRISQAAHRPGSRQG